MRASSLHAVGAEIYRIARGARQSFAPRRRDASRNRRDRPGVDLCTVEARKEHLMRDERGRKVETGVEARAGFLDRPVLIVLCVSLALAVVVLGALWLGFFTPGA
jgi:hypothetical protein